MPGEDIYWHYDENESFDSGTVRLHIPVITNENVALQICHQTLRWKEGELWYGDFSFPHRVRNLGQKTRIHLVLDLVVNEWLESQFPSALFEEQYERALARKKCESFYRFYDLQFLIKRYSRSIANNPARVLPKVLELVGLKKQSR